jgi:hypothetical protein
MVRGRTLLSINCYSPDNGYTYDDYLAGVADACGIALVQRRMRCCAAAHNEVLPRVKKWRMIYSKLALDESSCDCREIGIKLG